MKSYHQKNPESSLRVTLEMSTGDALKKLVSLLPGVKLKAPRKAELIETLEKFLFSPAVEDLYRRLDEMGKNAVREAVYSDDGRFDVFVFRSKYGSVPSFYEDSGNRSSYSGGPPTLLRLFIHCSKKHGPDLDYIPADFREFVRPFVPKPALFRLKNAKSLPKDPLRDRTVTCVAGEEGNRHIEYRSVSMPLMQRLNEQTAIRDLPIVLRLIEQEKLTVSPKNGRPTKSSTNLLSRLLCDGDFYEMNEPRSRWDAEIGPIKTFAWPMLVQAAKLAKKAEGKLTLTQQGRAALSASPEKTLKDIWVEWGKSKCFEEFNRIDIIKGQTGKGKRYFTDPRTRRTMVENALRQCPLDRWVEFDTFSRFMLASGFGFNVHEMPEYLYIGDSYYGSIGCGGYEAWPLFQERYLLCLLFEYAAPLGLIDVAYEEPYDARRNYTDHWGASDINCLSRYDGLKYFRLTSLGAFILGLTESWQSQTQTHQSVLAVLSKGIIRLTDGLLAPDEVLQIESFADVVGEGKWQLNEVKALLAVEKGASLDQFRTFLKERDPQPLPDRVESFLTGLERKGRACVCKGTVYLIECESMETADTIASHAQTHKYCQRTGEKGLVVPIDKEKAFRSALNSIGFGMPLV